MKNKLSRALIVLVVAPVAVGVGAAASASAATTGPAAPPPHNAVFLRVSPIRALVKLHGNQAGLSHILLQNKSAKAEPITSSIVGFQESSNGQIHPASIPAQMKRWLTVSPSKFTLAPGQVKSVSVRVLPTFRDPGDHYFGVAFNLPVGSIHSAKGHSHVGVGVSVTANSELIVTSPGPVRHDTTAKLTAPGFSTGGPINLSYAAKNSGTVYSLQNNLRATYGSQTVARYPGMLVLAGAHRTATAQWASPPAFGILHVHGPNGTVATVIRVPLWQTIAGLLVLAGLIVLWRIRRHRNRKAINTAVERKLAEAKHSS